jgi:indole-3-glycerol phosphate synthase
VILDRIVAETRRGLPSRISTTPLAELVARARDMSPARDMVAALRRPGVGIIAEVKRASPSRGLLAPNMDPVALARTYAKNGAAAISVLTDEPFFQGKLAYLSSIRRELGDACPPLLRKDFIIDPYQIHEARVAGADAILLIVAILTDAKLVELAQLAYELGLAALVEAHDEAELKRAIASGAQLVGINNRDLTTFHVDLNTTARLRAGIPQGVTLVSESGYHTENDIRYAAEMGADAVLIGESLVTAPNTGVKLASLARAGMVKVAHHA